MGAEAACQNNARGADNKIKQLISLPFTTTNVPAVTAVALSTSSRNAQSKGMESPFARPSQIGARRSSLKQPSTRSSQVSFSDRSESSSHQLVDIRQSGIGISSSRKRADTLDRSQNSAHDTWQQSRVDLRDDRPSRSHISFIDPGRMASILNSGVADIGADEEKHSGGMQASSPQLPDFVPLWIRIL
jgi:hypothetical protein